MQDVTIYIETSIHGPAKKDGKYIYLLECMREGVPVTREGRGSAEEATENQLVLLALRDALKRLNCRCAVVIYTNSGHGTAGTAHVYMRNGQTFLLRVDEKPDE